MQRLPNPGGGEHQASGLTATSRKVLDLPVAMAKRHRSAQPGPKSRQINTMFETTSLLVITPRMKPLPS